MSKPADLIAIYQCLCDRTRLRILNLLREGPLCVCHVQDVLGEPQVKVSKHLAYLKAHGVVTVKREGYWRIYALAPKPHRALELNLACLQDVANEDKVFHRDSEKLKALRGSLGEGAPACCAKPQPQPTKLKMA
jgi:ArsR family transcriptional regulator, arsenate/arsenite/antimonite-responsive transcriptional repressor